VHGEIVMTTQTRELKPGEFGLAEKLWEQYRDQKADREHERIFGVFEDANLAATARCTRHPDGIEMDCVFSSEKYRGKGYAKQAVGLLLQVCGWEQIYIHSTLVLTPFYKRMGFVPIPEDQLPRTIRDRFLFCFGEMQGCNVCPMTRDPNAGGA
jgi:N-acetylglutamate synthase-like GNAT family acetyltransferase